MKELEELAERLESLDSVRIAILFGSRVRGRPRADSDIDVCVVTEGEDDEALALSSGRMDISVFRRLPLYMRYRVLRDGEVLFCKDEGLLTKLRFWTVKLYLDEKHWRDRAVHEVLS